MFAELHLHLEGSIPAAALRLLGRRHGHPWGRRSGASLRRLYRYRDFRDFLALYRDICGLLRGPEDYALAARALARALARQRVSYAEVYVSVAVIRRAGLDYASVLRALDATAQAVEARDGPRIYWLLDSVRQWGAAAAEDVLRTAAAHPLGRVVGFGIGGDEGSVAAGEFRAAYRMARKLGLGTAIHAGEWLGPESVAAALTALPLDRIAHGVRAAERPALLARLRRRGVALDVAIGSNLATGAVRSLAEHPLKRLVDAGLDVTLSTDDPPMFRTTLAAEYRRANVLLGGDAAALERLRRNGFVRAFGPAGE